MYVVSNYNLKSVVLGFCGIDLESLELHGITGIFMELSGIKESVGIKKSLAESVGIKESLKSRRSNS